MPSAPLLPSSGFVKKLAGIAIPLALQTTLFHAIVVIDVVMLSQLSESHVAAAGLADRAFFLVMLILLGVSSAANILGSQYRGANDDRGLRRTLALAVYLSVGLGALATALFVTLAEEIIGAGSNDPVTIELGSRYLGILGWSLLTAGVLLPFETGLRTVERASVPTRYGVVEAVLNVGLNYVLIFGNLGAPELGIEGAALGSLIARLTRCCLLLWHTYRFEPAAAPRLEDFKAALSVERVRRFLGLAAPMVANGAVWAGGFFAQMLIYGGMGVGPLAAMTVIFSVQRVLIGLFAAIGIASSIVVGHELGARRPEGAWRSAWSSLVVSVGVALVGSGLLLSFREPILDSFPAIQSSTLRLTESVYVLLPIDLLLRAANVILILGALRAGGDVRFCLIVDSVCAWCIGLPLAYAAANFWGLPLYWVFAFALLEEGAKLILCLHRMFKRRWLRRLIEDDAVLLG